MGVSHTSKAIDLNLELEAIRRKQLRALILPLLFIRPRCFSPFEPHFYFSFASNHHWPEAYSTYERDNLDQGVVEVGGSIACPPVLAKHLLQRSLTLRNTPHLVVQSSE
ncbi:hypothetical protein LENED_004276 [Lentinula edodes]|uniref:Uncharacterized protein n=1 Tax=Lentinula edodes TaxID=5353 RepID=A0A1Q3E5S8_LENED|nr:hypothetical protein LENED_004276 [Lentinula edodes]